MSSFMFNNNQDNNPQQSLKVMEIIISYTPTSKSSGTYSAVVNSEPPLNVIVDQAKQKVSVQINPNEFYPVNSVFWIKNYLTTPTSFKLVSLVSTAPYIQLEILDNVPYFSVIGLNNLNSLSGLTSKQVINNTYVIAKCLITYDKPDKPYFGTFTEMYQENRWIGI